MVRLPGGIVGAALCAALLLGCTPPSQAPSELAGHWRVQQIAGASLGEGVRIFLDIDAQSGEIAGFTGCNAFDASLTAFGENISVGAVREEEGACPNAAAATDEARLLGVLSSVRRYVRRGRSLELLPAEHGEALVRLRLEDDTGAEPE